MIVALVAIITDVSIIIGLLLAGRASLHAADGMRKTRQRWWREASNEVEEHLEQVRRDRPDLFKWKYKVYDEDGRYMTSAKTLERAMVISGHHPERIEYIPHH